MRFFLHKISSLKSRPLSRLVLFVMKAGISQSSFIYYPSHFFSKKKRKCVIVQSDTGVCFLGTCGFRMCVRLHMNGINTTPVFYIQPRLWEIKFCTDNLQICCKRNIMPPKYIFFFYQRVEMFLMNCHVTKCFVTNTSAECSMALYWICCLTNIRDQD